MLGVGRVEDRTRRESSDRGLSGGHPRERVGGAALEGSSHATTLLTGDAAATSAGLTVRISKAIITSEFPRSVVGAQVVTRVAQSS